MLADQIDRCLAFQLTLFKTKMLSLYLTNLRCEFTKYASIYSTPSLPQLPAFCWCVTCLDMVLAKAALEGDW